MVEEKAKHAKKKEAFWQPAGRRIQRTQRFHALRCLSFSLMDTPQGSAGFAINKSVKGT